MKKGKLATLLCLCVCVAFCLLLVAGLFAARPFIGLYTEKTGQSTAALDAFVKTWYFAAPPTFVGLGLMCLLLVNLLRGIVFETVNARLLRGIGICAALAGVACLGFGFPYLSLTLCAVAGFFVALILAILARLFATAASIKAENDATI